jgi:hypothetical protein
MSLSQILEMNPPGLGFFSSGGSFAYNDRYGYYRFLTMAALSAKSVLILELIARGHTYEWIMNLHPGVTTLDIAIAAREILDHVYAKGVTTRSHSELLLKIRAQFPRAYFAWTPVEEAEMLAWFDAHMPLNVIAIKLARRPSAVAQRLRKLGRHVETEVH